MYSLASTTKSVRLKVIEAQLEVIYEKEKGNCFTGLCTQAKRKAGRGRRKSYVEPQIPLVCLTHPGLELKTPAVSTNLPL